MSGTEWTEPGRGATVGDLVDSYCAARGDWRIDHLIRRLAAEPPDWLRSNLRLTGEPLTAEDLERIARAK